MSNTRHPGKPAGLIRDLFDKLKRSRIISLREISGMTAILLGITLVLAFAPWGWWILALLIPGYLEKLLHRAPQKKLTGFIFGLGFFGFGVSWVFVSIHDYSQTPFIIAVLITVGFVALLSAITGLSCLLYQRIHPEKFVHRVMIFSSLWALTEAFRGWFLTGFPWLNLGDTLTGSFFSGLTPIIGVWGVSAVIVMVSMLLWRARFKPLLIAMSTMALMCGLSFVKYTSPSDPSYNVALLQGNIPQLTKWDPSLARQNFRVYYDLTDEMKDADIIIWPEASLPVPLPYGEKWIEYIKELVAPTDAAVLMGVLVEIDDESHHNSVITLDTPRLQYNKQHLVPFGEYIPFGNLLGSVFDWLQLPMAYTQAGDAAQDTIQIKDWRAGLMICFEIAFPHLTLNHAHNTDVLITVSNDTWFGRSIGPAQHLQMAQTRALETGRYVLRATNNGLTAVINPHGQLQLLAPAFTTTTLVATVPAMHGSTPLMWWTHWGVLAALLVVFVGSCFILKRRAGVR